MIEYVHEHIIQELKINNRTDIIFVIISILLNFIMLSVNTAIASSRNTNMIVMIIFILIIITVCLVAEIGLIKGRQTKIKLINGLLRMYKDNKVDGYYDSSLLESYNTRYNLFMLTVLVTGIAAIIVPFFSL